MWQNTATVLRVMHREGAKRLPTQIILHRVKQLQVCYIPKVPILKAILFLFSTPSPLPR